VKKYEVNMEVQKQGVISFPCDGVDYEEFEKMNYSDKMEILERNATMHEVQTNDFSLIPIRICKQ